MELKEGNYITIQSFMSKELELKGNELLIYAIIYGFSQTENQYYTGSRQYLATWCNITKKSVDIALKKLLDKGLIEKEEEYKNNVKYCKYRIIQPEYQATTGVSTKLIGGWSKKFPRVEKNLHQGGVKITPNNIEDNIEDNNYSYSYKETLFELIENNIGRTLNSIEIELIRTWEDNDLTRYIIKQCILNQKYNIKYIDRVITSTKLKGIKTVVDFEKESETFKQQKQIKVKKTETFSEKLKRLQEEAKNEEKEKK